MDEPSITCGSASRPFRIRTSMASVSSLRGRLYLLAKVPRRDGMPGLAQTRIALRLDDTPVNRRGGNGIGHRWSVKLVEWTETKRRRAARCHRAGACRSCPYSRRHRRHIHPNHAPGAAHWCDVNQLPPPSPT